MTTTATFNTIFGVNKFAPKKTQPRLKPALSSMARSCSAIRAQEEYGLELYPPHLKLDGTELVFEDGEWVLANEQDTRSTGEPADKDQENKTKQLTVENDFLKLKVDILLDMLTDATVQSHTKQDEKARSDIRIETSKRVQRKTREKQ